MAVNLPKGAKWFLILLAAAAVFCVQLLMNGKATKVIERFRLGRPVAIEAAPEVLSIIKEPLKRAVTKGKIPVIRFNLVNCGVCERVSRDVFTKPEWSKFAAERLEMTDFLMPTSFTEQDTELVKRINLMEALAKASDADQGFPLIAVLGRDGKLLGARAGYHGGGAENYIQWVEALSRGDKSEAPAPAAEQAKAELTANTNGQPAVAVTPAVSVPSMQVTNPPTPATAANAPAPVKTPSPTLAPEPQSEPMATPKLEIAVKGVSGSGSNKVVLLGIGKRNYPLMVGERKRVFVEQAGFTVECVGIEPGEVVVRVEGEEKDRHLVLPLQ